MGSQHYETILNIVGRDNRRDALHVDSAYKTECDCMVTVDSDILGKREALIKLIGLPIFSPDEKALQDFLDRGNPLRSSDQE